MKTTIINAAKGWAFSSTCFTSSLIGFSELEGLQSVFIIGCSIIGIIVFSVLVAFGAEGVTELFKKYKERWNGIGKNQQLRH